MNVEEKLQEHNIKLPKIPDKGFPFALGFIDGDKIILSGQTPTVGGKQKYVGTVGSTVSIEEAQDAAKICTLNLLAVLKMMLGDLDRVIRIIKLNGYVASTKDFTEHPSVIDVASNLLNNLFGEENKHARIAIGVASLPGGAPVEIEMVAQFK